MMRTRSMATVRPQPLRRPYFVLLVILLLSVSGGAFAQSVHDTYRLSPDLEVRKLADGVWLHTSWKDMQEWGRVLSNGIIVVSEGEALLIDTAWGEEPTEQLIDWISTTLKAPVVRAVVTHSHDDKMGGIGVLKRAGVTTYAQRLTSELAAQRGMALPDSLFTTEQLIPVGDRYVEAYFPGAGHTPDNVVVWLPDAKLLHGGCMIKEATSQHLGNLSDAVVSEWPASIERLMSRYGEAQVVVPSHGPVGDKELLDHTLHLLEAHLSEKVGG